MAGLVSLAMLHNALIVSIIARFLTLFVRFKKWAHFSVHTANIKFTILDWKKIQIFQHATIHTINLNRLNWVKIKSLCTSSNEFIELAK